MLLIVQVRSANYLNAQVQSIVQYIVQYRLQNSLQCPVQLSVQYMYVVMFYVMSKITVTNTNRPADRIYLSNLQSFSETNVFCTLYSTVYTAVYSTLFSTVQTIAFNSYYRVQEGGRSSYSDTQEQSILQYSVQYSVQNSVQKGVQSNVQFSAQYSIGKLGSRSLQDRDFGFYLEKDPFFGDYYSTPRDRRVSH